MGRNGIGTIADEIHQTRPFRSPEQEAAVSLLRTADLLRRAISEAVEPHGITAQQYNVLRILRGAGEGMPTLDIAGRLIEQTPGITRLLDRLEKKGLAARRRCGRDRRRVLCCVTGEGLRLLEALEAPVEEAGRAAFAAVASAELRSLIGSLDRVRSRLSHSEEVHNVSEAAAYAE